MKHMKHFFFFVLLTFISIALNAQNWAPVGAKWTYSLTFAFCGNVDTLVIRSVGDTVIQGKQCRILHKNATICDFRGADEYMYTWEGKTWYYDQSRAAFMMLFDINAEVGSRWAWYPGEYPSQDSINVVVDSVSTITINSTVLKVLYVIYYTEPPWFPVGDGRIIEGLGDSFYLFPWIWGACDGTFGGPFRCYDDAVIGHYEAGVVPTCNYTISGMDEAAGNHNEWKIFPNPVTSTLTVESLQTPDLPASAEILDLLGNSVFRSGSFKKALSIDMKELPSDIYILKIKRNGKESVRKIVK
jgi:hypothetical protein